MSEETAAPTCPDEEVAGVQGEAAESSESSELETRTAREALGQHDPAWLRGIRRRKAAWAEAPLINAPAALGLLARAVLTQGPDFVYSPMRGTPCYNLPIGEIAPFEQPVSISDPSPKRITGCLVGTALMLADHPVAASVPDFAASGVTAFAEALTGLALALLSQAQQEQDNGATWGQAYQAAVQTVRKEGAARYPGEPIPVLGWEVPSNDAAA